MQVVQVNEHCFIPYFFAFIYTSLMEPCLALSVEIMKILLRNGGGEVQIPQALNKIYASFVITANYSLQH